GRRWLVRKVSPTAARSFRNHARLASIDIHSLTSLALNAHVSTTWVPCVLMTLTRWPAATRAAAPRRAGMSCWVVAMEFSSLRAPVGCRKTCLLAAAEAVVASVARDLGRAPTVEQRGVGLPDLHAEGAARAEGIARLLAPHLHGQVAVGAGGDGAEHVDLGEELDEVPLLGRARLDEVAVVGGEAGDLEDVEHIVYVELGEAIRRHRPHEIGVAAEIEVLAVEHLVDVGIAARAEEIVAAGAVFVAAVADGVVGDGEHGPEIGQAGPEPIVGGDMRSVELLGPGRPEPLARIAEVPHVEVGDLRPLHGHDAEELAGAHRPRLAPALGDDESLDGGASLCALGEAVVERTIHLDR